MQHLYKGIALYTFINSGSNIYTANKEHNPHNKLLQEGLPTFKYPCLLLNNNSNHRTHLIRLITFT